MLQRILYESELWKTKYPVDVYEIEEQIQYVI